jgi:hypothetical protein
MYTIFRRLQSSPRTTTAGSNQPSLPYVPHPPPTAHIMQQDSAGNPKAVPQEPSGESSIPRANSRRHSKPRAKPMQKQNCPCRRAKSTTTQTPSRLPVDTRRRRDNNPVKG